MGERFLPAERKINGHTKRKTEGGAMKRPMPLSLSCSFLAASLLALAGCERTATPVVPAVPVATAAPIATAVPVATAVPIVPAVPPSKISAANYALIRLGMSKAQVETILGAPTSSETKDVVIFKKTTYRYEDGARFILLTFKNDELDSRDSNLVAEP